MVHHIISKYFFYFAILNINLLSIVVGISLAWSSPILPKLTEVNDENPFGAVISQSDTSWISSILSLGAVCGAFISGLSVDRFGRRWTMVSIGIPMVVMYVVLAFANAVWQYVVARLIIGVSVGASFTIAPMMVAELSPDDRRGAAVGAISFFVVIGMLLTYSIGPYASIRFFNLICALVPALYVITFIVFMPESPQFLIMRGQTERARAVLVQIRPPATDVDIELSVITEVVSASAASNTIADLTTKGSVKALLIVVALVIFQQCSGINVVLMFTQTIFEETGSSIRPDVSAIVVGAVQVLASMTTPVFIDRSGRRRLFLISGLGIMITEVPLGLYFFLKDIGTNVTEIYWLPITCLVGYIFFYNCGFGVIPWALMAEMFAPNVKSIACAISAGTCWFVSFILTQFFVEIGEKIGVGGTFWVFASIVAISIIFIYICVPETKGMNQKQIQDMLNK